MTISHKRWWYFAYILVIIPLGLSTRWCSNYFPQLVAHYGGDVLYATLIFFCLRFVFIKKMLWKVAVWSYLFCILIELQQLYQAPWAVAFRNIPLVGIILGYSFLWSDLVCYLVGVILGWGVGLATEGFRKNIIQKLN